MAGVKRKSLNAKETTCYVMHLSLYINLFTIFNIFVTFVILFETVCPFSTYIIVYKELL